MWLPLWFGPRSRYSIAEHFRSKGNHKGCPYISELDCQGAKAGLILCFARVKREFPCLTGYKFRVLNNSNRGFALNGDVNELTLPYGRSVLDFVRDDKHEPLRKSHCEEKSLIDLLHKSSESICGWGAYG